MRLICPNCDAQYEIPDEVMPKAGRDVQCSNCGQTWFQHHPENEADADEAPAQPQDQPDPDEEVTIPQPAIAQPRPAQAERKQLDPAITDILKEEARTESEARRKAAPDPIETQPDLGLEETADPANGGGPERRKMQARQRMARLRGEPAPLSEAEVTAAAMSSRRDLLPDIEEINSTLRTGGDRKGRSDTQVDIDSPTISRRKRGFRRGFMITFSVFLVLLALYAFAPSIAKAVPQADPYLSGYVAWVDGLRVSLDGQVQALLRWLDIKATQSAS